MDSGELFVKIDGALWMEWWHVNNWAMELFMIVYANCHLDQMKIYLFLLMNLLARVMRIVYRIAMADLEIHLTIVTIPKMLGLFALMPVSFTSVCRLACYNPFCIGLVGGSVVYEGRVEIFRDNSWTTVCDDGWDSTDADVFCRQIGYPGAEFSYGLAEFGQGSGTIQIRNVACTGTETDIRDCTFSTDANIACTHSEDAGVRCLRNISRLINTLFTI